MKNRAYFIFSLLLALSMLLSACAPTATQVAPVEPAVVQTEAPTAAPPTAEPPTPTPLPPPDFAALFTTLIEGIPADKGYGTVKPASLSEEFASAAPFVLDVREAAEVEKDGFIEGAVNIPVREVFQNLNKLPGLDDPIVVYCASGHRGGFVFAALKLMGYTNVRNLNGGLGAWKKAELPVVTGSMPAAAESISTPIVENEPLYTALNELLSGLPEGFYTTPAAKLAEALTTADAPVIVDVRTAEEQKKDGYIEGSVNIPLQEFMGKLDQLPAKDAPIVVYCASGHRGSVALMALRMLGYTNVTNLAGGLAGWKAANMPVVGGALDWNAIWSEYLSTLPADQGFYSVKPDVLNTALVENPPFMLDVREAAEIEKDGFIAGAINIPVRDVLKNLDMLPAQDQPIVVYCASGHRGSFIVAALRLLGYKDVKNLAGGLGAWKKAEFAVESGAPAAAVAGTAPIVDATRLAELDKFISGLPEGFYTVKSPDLNTEITSGDALVIVDVSTDKEYAEGHIEGSINIPVNDLFSSLDQLPDKAAKIVVLCKSGHRGGMALMALRMLGYSEIRSLAGGLNAWVAAELPVVK